uniref:hypothetical protein n=2 Tax=Pseudomonas aeruginosa TaxID=287 RepID=UPI0032E857A2
PQNDVTLKMPAFEWVHVQLHQQKGMISLSPPTICNSAVGTTAAVKSEWLVLGRSSASQPISAPKLEYEENQGVDSILCIDGRAYKVRLGTQELMHRLEELPRTQSIRQYQLKPIPCAALHKS